LVGILATLLILSTLAFFGACAWSAYCRRELFAHMRIAHPELWNELGQPQLSTAPLSRRIPLTLFVAYREYRASDDPKLVALGERAFVAFLLTVAAFAAFTAALGRYWVATSPLAGA
jgi:hypothetical protein